MKRVKSAIYQHFIHTTDYRKKNVSKKLIKLLLQRLVAIGKI